MNLLTILTTALAYGTPFDDEKTIMIGEQGKLHPFSGCASESIMTTENTQLPSPELRTPKFKRNKKRGY